MSRVLAAPLATLPELPIADWRAALAAALAAGQRIVTLFGRPQGPDHVTLTAVLDAPGLSVLRATAERARGYHALTPEFPALHAFEREVHEQTGLRVAGHPWLKPIRFEGGGPRASDAYPFYEVRGKEVHEVAVGPIHAGVIEPGAFRFMCHGEDVLHLEIHLGYQHRGVERRLVGRPPGSLAPLVETIAGDTSVGHGWAHAAALEALAGSADDPARDDARAALLELERIAMHLATLSGLAADVGFLQGATGYGRLRTTAINTTMLLCGSRFGRGAVRAAGSGVRLEPGTEALATVRRSLALLAADVPTVDERFFSSATVQHRLVGVGTVTTADAEAIGLVGPAARASGVARDARAGAGGVWARRPIEPAIAPGGDCFARARVRSLEIARSLAWLDALLAETPRFTPARTPLAPLAPAHLAIAVVEGLRGEIVHAMETDAAGALAHAKVQDPSLRNWLGLALAVRGNEISDFPICNKSFDLSYCGNDL